MSMTITCPITGDTNCKDRDCELHYMDAPLRLTPSPAPRRPAVSIVTFAIYAGCIPLANWMITEFGVVSLGFGLMAPAGVFAAGLAFGTRDAIQRWAGKRWAFAAIALGVALSFVISTPTLALASAAAFGLSELLDMAVFTPIQRRSFGGAVVLSNIVGAVVDSVVFLSLAFGSLAFLPGQVIGKLLMILPVLAVLIPLRMRECRAHAA